MSQYLLRISSTGYASPGLFGPFVNDDQVGWMGDLTLNYNAEASYYGAASSNHLELFEPYLQTILDYLPSARLMADSQYPGSACAGALYFAGHILPFGVTSSSNGDMGQKQMGLFASEQDGLLHDAQDCAEELCSPDGVNQKDPTVVLSMLPAFFRTAGELAALLGHPESQRRWAAHARRIAAYPTARWRGKDVLRNSAGQGEESGPTLDDEVWALSEGVWGTGGQFASFPLGTVSLSSSATSLEVVRQSLEHFFDIWPGGKQGNSFCSIFAAANRVAWRPAHLFQLWESYLKNQSDPDCIMYPNGMVLGCGGTGLENVGATAYVNELLLQSHEGFLRIFPGWNSTGSFHLRAEGGFEVREHVSMRGYSRPMHPDRSSKDASEAGFGCELDRRNLPPAPKFDGDRKADPRCFRKYLNKVDSYVALAEKIIDHNEIGLRLHAALEGEAADYLEDVPARTFGEIDGWRVLLRILRDKYDEPPMHKVGTAMKNFFNLQMAQDKTITMREVAEHLDRAARQCRDAGLDLPDAVMIHVFFQHTGASNERQANFLLRTGGQYDWAKIKAAIDILYPNTTVRVPASGAKASGYRGRAAHEVHWSSSDWQLPDLQDPSIVWDSWLYENDPVEMIAEQTLYEAVDENLIPQNLARDLTACFNTHRENRRQLARAVQARGYYVRGGKGKSGGRGKGDRGKGRGGKKGKGGKSAGGKTRGGLTLQELKAKTACAECGAIGHWKEECPKRQSNLTHHTEYREPDPYYEPDFEEYDYDADEQAYEEWDPETWDQWQEEAPRSSHAAGRQTDAAAAVEEENLRAIHALRKKVSQAAPLAGPSKSTSATTSKTAPPAKVPPVMPKTPPVMPKQVKQVRNVYVEQSKHDIVEEQGFNKHSLYSDEFVDQHGTMARVKAILTAKPPGTTFSGSEARAAVRTHATSSAHVATRTDETGLTGSVWDLLKDHSKAPDLDSLRKTRDVLAARRVKFESPTSPRSALSLTRRPPTVQTDKVYLTIDTACENTVVGSVYLEKVLNKLGEHGLMPITHEENEQYCFGPGAPKTSTTRLSVPIGIDGKPLVIRTSVIQEDKQAANRVPFLAGQDWLVLMGAVVDIGNNKMSLPAAGCEVPLLVDVSGHLVISIEDYPCTGWPQGLWTKVDEYPGAIFAVSHELQKSASQPSKTRLSKGACQQAWARLVIKMDMLWSLMARSLSVNHLIREFKHRAPALMGYMEAIMQVENAAMLPATLPPSTTKALGQTAKAKGNWTPYPEKVKMPFIKLTKEVFESQQKRGGHALVENPASADSWSEPEFLALRQKYFETTSCMCRFGMVGKHGLPMLKRVRWMGTHPTFADYLNLQCQHQHEHELVEGQNTPLSACYPPDLADTIIRAYLDVVQQEDFGVHYDWQVMETRHVHYVDVSRQESDWRPLLAQAEEVLARKVQSSCFLDITSDLYQKIIPLVPWQILNVQIAHLPKAKRLRPGLENCHRASVLLQTDDVLVIETEHLPTAQAPRERFVAPVKVAIFVLGHAPGEPQEPVPARLPPQSPPLRDGDVVEDPMAEAAEEGMAHEGLVRQDFASGECWFSGSPLKAEQKRSFCRTPTAFNRAFRYTANKIIDDKQLAGDIDMQLLGSLVGAAMNEKVRTCGASANQWLFGRNPRVAEDLLSPDGQLDALRGLDQDEELRLRTYIRSQADVLISQFKIDDALRKAVLRQGRPSRLTYEPGELVAFWRQVKKKKGKLLQPGWFRGTIVGPHKGDDSQNNYWVTSGGKLILVSKEQLRPTFGTERWKIDEQALQGLLDNFPEEFYNGRDGEPPDDMAIDEKAVREEVAVPVFESDEEQLVEYSPTDPRTPDAQEDDQPSSAAASRPADAHGSIGSNTTHLPSMREDRAPGTPMHSLLRQPPPISVPEEVPIVDPDFEDDMALPPPAREAREPEGAPPEKKARIEAPSGDPPGPDHRVPAQEEIPTYDTELYVRPRGALWGCSFSGFRKSAMTRKQQKALEKEIPWRMIPESERQGYADALAKEWSTWLKYQAVEILSMEASLHVEENTDPARILDSRVCYRNKNAAYSWLPVKHKARIVCRGDRDPDLLTLRRDAPTMTRLGLLLILQICASSPGWFLFNSDITGAFLQGDQSLASRKEPLYLRPPKEGLPGLQPGQLLLVVRGIFGLANSPRLFWRHLRDSLVTMGFVQSTLDRAVFMYYRKGRLILVLGAHVDDLIGAGKPKEADEILDEIKKTFDFGSWSDSRTDETLEYGGKQIVRDGEKVILTQKKFILASSTTKIPKWRSATPNAPLLPQEHTELHSLGGCLHWLVGQSRPDLAAATSLYMSGQPTVHNLTQLNKLALEAQSTADWGLTFLPVPLSEARWVAFSDSSWANASELKSQAGYMVFIAGKNVDSLEGDVASLVDWRSHRIKRQCRSTLASETMAMDAAVDSAIFAREFMAEILVEAYNPLQSGRLPSNFMPLEAVTDCRSLFDILVKDGPLSSTQEKRLAIDIGGLKETATEVDPDGERLNEVFKWIDTNHQLADHLTKAKYLEELAHEECEAILQHFPPERQALILEHIAEDMMWGCVEVAAFRSTKRSMVRARRGLGRCQRQV
eukprot:g7523.t1